MEIDTRRTGALGEDIAALLLTARGYRVVARDVRVGRQQIDLVVERGTLLVAVEVKWRRRSALAESARVAWRRGQRARAGEAVLRLMAERSGPAPARPWRFDLVAITETPRGWIVEHVRAAWSPGDAWW